MFKINKARNSCERNWIFLSKSHLNSYLILIWLMGSSAFAAEPWPCDATKAESCMVNLKDHIQAISQSIENLNNIDKTDIGILCTQSVLGSKFNECYLNATSNCPRISMKLESNWELVQNEVFKLCENVCPGFISRTTNVSRCTHNIRNDPTLLTNFDLFCDSMNTTLQCALNEANGCSFYSDIVRSLLPRDAEAFSVSVCREECKTIDTSLDKLSRCQKHMDSILATMDCSMMEIFKQCLFESGVSGCPILESVVNATYPYHIYGPLETMCNGSKVTYPTPDEDCQQVMPHGYSEIRECMETILLSAHRYETMGQKKIQQNDCLQFNLAKECIENSGASKCQLLDNYLKQMEDSHRSYFERLQRECPNSNKTLLKILNGTSASSRLATAGFYWFIAILFIAILPYLITFD